MLNEYSGHVTQLIYPQKAALKERAKTGLLKNVLYLGCPLHNEFGKLRGGTLVTYSFVDLKQSLLVLF